MKQDQYLFIVGQVRSLNQNYIFELSDAWHIELKQLSDSLGHKVSISFPEYTENFFHRPPDGLNYKFRVHVICLIGRRNVNGPSLASELVDISQYPADMQYVLTRNDQVSHLVILDVLQAIIKIFCLIQNVGILVIDDPGSYLGELSAV